MRKFLVVCVVFGFWWFDQTRSWHEAESNVDAVGLGLLKAWLSV